MPGYCTFCDPPHDWTKPPYLCEEKGVGWGAGRGSKNGFLTKTPSFSKNLENFEGGLSGPKFRQNHFPGFFYRGTFSKLAKSAI